MTASHFPRLVTALIAVVCVMAACQSPKLQKTAAPSLNAAAQPTRNNGYSLLHQLLDEQKDVSILRFIKPEDTDLKALINKIAAASGDGSKLLEDFARHDPSINLADIQLPPGETAARAAIASTKQKELLSQTGDEFELTLLLTQTEALSYAWHMAKVTGENEPQPQRARALAGLSDTMRNLYQETFALLLSKTKSSAAHAVKARAD